MCSRRDGDYEIYVMKPDGSDQRPLTDNDTDEWSPAWSPDGTRIAFRSNRGGFVDVYTMNADGSSTPQQLTHNAEIDQDRAPSWRPGGAGPTR
jgi:Tol biopolymer transport system component